MAPVEVVAPTVIDAATPVETPQPVVVEPSAAAQVLFLGEQAIVASAAGTVSGSLILSAVLIMITLAAGAFLQSKDALRKPLYKGGMFSGKAKDTTEESGMLGEYLLIKS